MQDPQKKKYSWAHAFSHTAGVCDYIDLRYCRLMCASCAWAYIWLWESIKKKTHRERAIDKNPQMQN